MVGGECLLKTLRVLRLRLTKFQGGGKAVFAEIALRFFGFAVDWRAVFVKNRFAIFSGSRRA
ncbi:hypothetical protein [Methanimicrococcus blatticola]|uniref:hypothetical protein n=1 Tax=Methanimicrococcus blatticola TaxID=91560 RepID=UPI001060004E|nr:hypothetical protein [Methanimicrococcus blatticola]MBZ3936398.1 hypothetical protein [Methanimicrococcus blatticola]MCC2509560.1 hypothetical protein [Methanimicrococcus blatticola]